MMLSGRSQFYQKTIAACADTQLTEKLYSATYRQYDGRRAICEELGDVDHFRQLAGDLRDHVLGNLDEYLAKLVENLERSGVKIHWAENADRAREIICGVARDNGVDRIVKSKSMVTEEIELNAALAAEDIEVTETDLGEFIIQLAGHKPAHIIIPAVHCSTGDIAEIFRDKIGYTGPTEPEALTKAARKVLRDKFKVAQMGISGVNFGIADPGLITVCTNEGNGRYVTTAPPIYVAVMGMERIVPDLDAAALILKLLAKFSTGQRITQYTNMIAGPAHHDGPRQVHLVILDNGRSGILGSKYWQILRCIRCGSCLNACPVFRHIGGQAFPGCYSGPIGTVLLSLLMGPKQVPELAKASSLCQLCADVCPVKIPLPEFLLELRNDTAGSGIGGFFEKVAMSGWAWALSHPRLYRFGQKAMRWGLKPFGKAGWVRRLPGPPGKWTAVKDLPFPAGKSFLAQMPSRRTTENEDPTSDE